MLDLDDGHRAAAGHPGAAIIPAVLAQASCESYTTSDLLTAIAIGYEVGVRLSRSRDFRKVDSVATGRWSGVGATAALGWMRSTAEPVLAQALGISSRHAPSLANSPVPAEAGHVKEGIPWANATGVAALELAEMGHTGSLTGFSDPNHYDRRAILEGWGDGWLIEGTYYKPYSACRYAHSALDGFAALMAEEPIAPEAIESIELDLFSRALSLSNLLQPPSIEAAQYSIPYVVGLFAVHGSKALLPMQPDCLGDQRAIAVASRVQMRLDPQFDSMFPASAPCRITITAHGRRRSREVILPWGEPGNPMDWTALRDKQRSACSDLLSQSTIEELWSAIETMRVGDIKPLLAFLATPLSKPAYRAAS
jgi:2-methylcitrate dehydratase PrpD